MTRGIVRSANTVASRQVSEVIDLKAVSHQWGRIDRASGYKKYSIVDTYTRQAYH